MMHIIIGLFFIALGIWGVFDEWYYVVDFVKGSSALVLVLIGVIGILSGVAGDGDEATDELAPEPPEPTSDEDSEDLTADLAEVPQEG